MTKRGQDPAVEIDLIPAVQYASKARPVIFPSQVSEEDDEDGSFEPDSEEDLDFMDMEQKIYEQEQADEAQNSEYVCCECGYINRRKDGHHSGIKCPHSGRCGQCGNAWPCAEHKDQVRKSRSKSRRKAG